MKALFFDSGTIITMTMNNLLWILEPPKEKFGGQFLITEGVKFELVDKPLKIKRFEFEALQVSKLIRDGVLEISKEVPKKKSKLLSFANKSFKARGKWLRIVQDAEIEVLSLACGFGCNAVIDERTIRLLVEDPENLRKLLEKRLRAAVSMDKKNVELFRKEVESVSIIRSIELVSIAYELGLFKDLVPRRKNGKEVLLDAVMWGVKLDGCAVTATEIDDLKKNILSKGQ